MNWQTLPLLVLMLQLLSMTSAACLPSVVLNAQPVTTTELLTSNEGVLTNIPEAFVGNSRVALLQDVEAQSLLQLASCGTAETEFAVMVWHCLPCSKEANGNLPSVLMASGWTTERCSALLPGEHPMRTFLTKVRGQDGYSYIPVETYASIIAVFEITQPLPAGWCPRFVGPTGSSPSMCPKCIPTNPPAAPVPVPPGSPPAAASPQQPKQQYPGASARQSSPAQVTHAPPTPSPSTLAPDTAAPPTPSPHEQTLPNGLRAYYPFDGNANDVSGNNRHGAVSGATLTSDRLGNPNSAYYFNGVNNIINLGTAGFTNMERFSVSAWVNLASDPSVLGAIVSCRRTPSAEAFSLEVTKDGFPRTEYIYAFEWERWVTGPVRLEIGQWTHIATVMDSTGVSFYVDGVEVARNNGGGSLKSEHTQNTAIGARSDGQFHFFHGMIDEVRIWDRALTADEVMAARGEVIVSLGLVGDYPFTGNADDVSGQGRHGTVNGASLTTGRDSTVSGSYSFSQTNSISVGDKFSTPYFTVATWVSLSQYQPASQLVKSMRGSSVGYAIEVNSAGKLLANLFLDGTLITVDSGATLVLNQWYHLAVTFDGLNIAMYVFGERVHFGQVSGVLSQDAGETTFGEGLVGLLDSVKLYDQALPPSKISELCPPVNAPGSDGLVDYLPLTDINTENPTVAAVQARHFMNAYGDMSAYTFDGSTEYINLGARTFTSAVSVYAIVNRIDAQFQTDETIVSHRTPSRGFSLRLVSGFLHFFVWNTAQATWSSAAAAQELPRGVWNSVVGTYDGRVIKVFVNGTEVASTVSDGGPLESVSGDLVLGAASTLDRHFWRGVIDEVRVYDVALTAERVKLIGEAYLRRTGCLAALDEQLDDFSGYGMTCPIGERVDYWNRVSCPQPDTYLYEYGCGIGQLLSLTTFTRRTGTGCKYARTYDDYLSLYVPSTTSCAPSEETMGWTVVKGDCRDIGMHVVDYQCASKIGEDGLMASYGFLAGSLADDSGMNVDGVAGPSPPTQTVDAWGNANAALSFTNSYINIGTEIDMPAFTVMAWVKPEENVAGKVYTIIDSRSGLGEGFILRIRDGKYEVTVNGERPFFPWMTAASPRSIMINYEHVAATYDGQTLKLYVLGDIEKEFVTYSGPLKMLATDTFIGARRHSNGVFTDYFRGSIDDVRIYNKALSAAEVLSLRGALPQHIIQQGARQIRALRDVYYMCTTAAVEQTPPAFCWRKSILYDCGNPLINCGPLACSFSSATCASEIINMAAETARGVYTASTMFTGGVAGMSYTMNKVIMAGFSTSASMMAGGFQMAKQHWADIDPAFLPARITMATNTVKGKLTTEQRTLLDDFQIKNTCEHAVTRIHYAMKSATSAGGTVPTSLSNALGVSALVSDCGKVSAGGATENQKISCAAAALRFASFFDPTGLTAVAAAYMKPKCD
eukprot:TRINITY_DN3582_c0_g1_i2.p1 TRINITY_DN3582_c0_g1~~TRINITY_DN3582_c0_g1_i2.p1  ORF type:complete len:1436 (+),score=300.40 TRINITY_DN3582_c0_g1_i2:392-4699(+)